MRYWYASNELLLLWDCSDTAVNYLASTKAPHWSVAMEMATHLPSWSTQQKLSMATPWASLPFQPYYQPCCLWCLCIQWPSYGSCINHQYQQWCVINLVVITCISLLLPTSVWSAKNLTGSLIFWSRIWCKTCQFTRGTECLVWTLIQRNLPR